MRPIAVSMVAMALAAGCMSAPQPGRWHHIQFGTVGADHPQLAADRDACGRKAYARGITINGQSVTDRNVAFKAYIDEFAKSIDDQPGAGAFAGTQGALAVARGKVDHTPPQARPAAKEPDFGPAFKALEKETWDCVQANGWQEAK